MPKSKEMWIYKAQKYALRCLHSTCSVRLILHTHQHRASAQIFNAYVVLDSTRPRYSPNMELNAAVTSQESITAFLLYSIRSYLPFRLRLSSPLLCALIAARCPRQRISALHPRPPSPIWSRGRLHTIQHISILHPQHCSSPIVSGSYHNPGFPLQSFITQTYPRLSISFLSVYSSYRRILPQFAAYPVLIPVYLLQYEIHDNSKKYYHTLIVEAYGSDVCFRRLISVACSRISQHNLG